LTLKSLCGFSNGEIARGLLLPEETVKKRLQRARGYLEEHGVDFSVPRAEELADRLESVHQCLYLLFNEGYAASSGDSVVRMDLCEEAARLCQLLCESRWCRSSATFALLALMLFHAARFDARTDSQGRLLLIDEQDRSRWDQSLIARARDLLDLSAEGKSISPFHLEAGIALMHCTSASFAETDWPAILQLYDALLLLQPSPVYRLNRAIVLAHLNGPAAAIPLIEPLAEDNSLRLYHLVDATLGELYRRTGDMTRAQHHLKRARDRTQSASEKELLDRRLAACQSDQTV
jgi:RNA polymerase sigma-70 factor (ECF subfamily)